MLWHTPVVKSERVGVESSKGQIRDSLGEEELDKCWVRVRVRLPMCQV